ncbi:MAG: putative rane protein [Bacteroidetes bacterium]|nr:putative rane protein [Bacteroidota bacterium]
MMATLALLVTLLCIGLLAVIAFLVSHSSKIKSIEKHIGSLQARAAVLESRTREILEQYAGTRIPVSTKEVVRGGPASEVVRGISATDGVRAVADSEAAGMATQPLPTPPAPPVTPKVPVAPEKPSRTRGEWEALIGGKLLNRIGALALIIAVGLFLKYAFDNNWFTEWMRVSIGVLVGVVCLLAAARAARKGFEVFAQGLVGAGLAILYLSVYASFNFYALVSQPAAFVAMSAVTILSYVQAFRYKALAVSLLGLLGGFLTPFMLSTGEANMVGLFTYVALLDLGLLLVVARNDAWMILDPLALLGTYCIYSLWHSEYYTQDKLIPVVLFLTLFWIMFHGFDLYRLRRGVATYAEFRRAISGVHSVIFFGALSIVLTERPVTEQAMMTFVLGLLYIGSALFTGENTAERKSAFTQFMVTGIVLSLVAVLIAWDGFNKIVIWSLACVSVVWMGVTKQQKSVWATGLILLAFSFPMMLFSPGALLYHPLESFRPVLNGRALTFLIVALSLGMGGHLYWSGLPKPSLKVHEFFQYGWFFLIVIALNVETIDLFSLWMVNAADADRELLAFQRLMAVAGVNGLLGFALVGLGLGVRMRPLFYGSLWLLLGAAALAALRGLWYSPTEAFVPILNIRVVVMLLMVFGFFGLRKVLAQSPDVFEWGKEFAAIASYVPVILLLVLFSAEGWDFFEREKVQAAALMSDSSAGETDRLHNLQHLTLSSVWLIFSIVLMLFGLLKRERGLRFLAIGLFGIAILKIFIYDLSFLDTLYRIFSFVGLGVILLAASYLYQRYRDVIVGNPSPPAAR